MMSYSSVLLITCVVGTSAESRSRVPCWWWCGIRCRRTKGWADRISRNCLYRRIWCCLSVGSVDSSSSVLDQSVTVSRWNIEPYLWCHRAIWTNRRESTCQRIGQDEWYASRRYPVSITVDSEHHAEPNHYHVHRDEHQKRKIVGWEAVSSFRFLLNKQSCQTRKRYG